MIDDITLIAVDVFQLVLGLYLGSLAERSNWVNAGRSGLRKAAGGKLWRVAEDE